MIIKKPAFSNMGSTLIDFVITHDVYGEMPYTAGKDDPDEFSALLFSRAMMGEFGSILPYVAPIKSTQQITAELRHDEIKLATDDLRQDAEIKNFAAQTKSELLADIANITNIAEAKRHIKRLSMLVWIMAKDL